MNGGAKVWYFPDGYLPEKSGDGVMEAHEALMLLNTMEQDADVRIDVYFSDQPPVMDIPIKIGAERIKTIRLDHSEDLVGLSIPTLTQYSLRIRSDRPIVAQFGRLDTTQNNMAYYGADGFHED